MPDETSLATLLAEQSTAARRFVVEAVPDNSESVKVTLLTPGMRRTCKSGVVLPSKAIKSIKKTGEEISCCGKKLQAVELTFSDEKAVSYDDLFSTVKDVHTSVTTNIAHSLHSLPTASEHPSFMSAPQTTGKEPVGGGGGTTTPIAFADSSYGSCMVNAMLRGPNGHKAFRIWMDTWANICEALYG